MVYFSFTDEGTLLDSHDLEDAQSSVVVAVKVRRESPSEPQYTTYDTDLAKLRPKLNGRKKRDSVSSEEGSGDDSTEPKKNTHRRKRDADY